MDDRHTKVLELDKILAMLADCCVTEDAKALAGQIQPQQELASVTRLMSQTADAHQLTSRFGTPSIRQIKNCSPQMQRAKRGAMLSMGELLEVAYILQTARKLLAWRRQFEEEQTALDPMLSTLTADRYLEEEITEKILSEEEIADAASPVLADIRRKIRLSGQKARELLEKMTRSTTYQKYLQEQIVTIRNGRFVLPVRAEHKNEIKGLVHDTSSSGATLFIEPMQVVDANNEIRELESKERHEINRILLELSALVGENAGMIQDNYDMIIRLDLLFAKSRLADRMRATVPQIIGTGEINLSKARHPLINRDSVVPIDIQLGGEFDTLIITGPNTGGKTVALKTLGLLTLMALSGLMIPAGENSMISVFDKVLADIGDEQSIEQSLSTFSGHMTNIVSILNAADENALVLIDELGAGTDPVEGAALAVSIIERLRQLGAKVAATTHYAEMKVYALESGGVENASCEFDITTLRPTYRLLIGVPGRSNAFAISRRLGLEESVIERARLLVSSENQRFEDVVSGLEDTRQKLEREQEQAGLFRREAQRLEEEIREEKRRLDQEREQELNRARGQARAIVEQVRLKSEALLDELLELKKRKDQENFSQLVSGVRGRFKSDIAELEKTADPIVSRDDEDYVLPRELSPGDTVYITELGTHGAVLAIEGDTVQVQAGIIKTKVKKSSLRLAEQTKKKPAGKSSARKVVAAAKEAVKTEIDLRGMTAGEALMELDQYMDRAVLSGVNIVSIIHGKGTGALRKAVHERLKKSSAVKSYRLGVYGEGDSGVTIAELK